MRPADGGIFDRCDAALRTDSYLESAFLWQLPEIRGQEFRGREGTSWKWKAIPDYFPVLNLWGKQVDHPLDGRKTVSSAHVYVAYMQKDIINHSRDAAGWTGLMPIQG